VLIDWLASGRWACGERWAFLRYQTRTEIECDGRSAFRDAMLLDQQDGPIAGPMRMGRFDCFATVVIVGRPLREHAGQLREYVESQPSPAMETPLLFAASPITDGIVLRVAGESSKASVDGFARDWRLSHPYSVKIPGCANGEAAQPLKRLGQCWKVKCIYLPRYRQAAVTQRRVSRTKAIGPRCSA